MGELQPEDLKGLRSVSRQILSPGAKLPPDLATIEIGRYITPTGLELRNVGYREWYSIGQTLMFMYEWTPWAIGDWLNYGERVFGEKYAQAAKVSGRSVRTLYNLAYIARHIPPENRVERLDIGHHDAVASLPAEEQRMLLQEAKRIDEESGGNYTVYEFRERVREHKQRATEVEYLANGSGPAPGEEGPPVIVVCPHCGGTGEMVLPEGVE